MPAFFASSPNKGAKAFTVLELLVAFAVFSLMVALLFTMMSQANKAWQQALGQKDRSEVGRACLDLIARDLQGTIPPLPGVGTNTVNFELDDAGGTNDALYWQTISPINRSKSDIATIGYYVSSNELCRLYTNAPLVNLASTANPANAANVLAKGVVRLDVTLYDRDGSAVTNSASYSTNLPVSAEVKLAVADARTLLQHPTLSVPDLDNPPAGVNVYRTRIDLPCSP